MAFPIFPVVEHEDVFLNTCLPLHSLPEESVTQELFVASSILNHAFSGVSSMTTLIRSVLSVDGNSLWPCHVMCRSIPGCTWFVLTSPERC